MSYKKQYVLAEFFLFHFYIALFLVTMPYKDSWWVSCGLFLVAALMVAVEYLRTKMLTSPLILWYVFWAGLITLARMDLGLFQVPIAWNDKLTEVIIFTTLAFFWGYWIGELPMYFTIGRMGRRKRSRIPLSLQINFDRLSDCLEAIFTLAIFCYLMNVLQFGYIPQFAGGVNAARIPFVQTSWYTVVHCSRGMMAIVPLALKYQNIAKRRKKLITLVIVFILCEALSGWRGYVFQSVLLFAPSYFILSDYKSSRERKKNLRKIILIALLAVAFVAFIGITRDGTEKSRSNVLKFTMETIYLYMSPNFLNLQNAMRTIEPQGGLLYTTEAIWSIFFQPAQMPGYHSIYQNIGAANVSTYLLQPWADGGVGGCVGWSIVFGVLAGDAFKRARRGTSFTGLGMVGVAGVTIFTLHNGFILRSTSMLVWMVLYVLLDQYSRIPLEHITSRR